MRALVHKELREVAGITAVAAVAYLALVVSLVGGGVFERIPGMPAGVQGVPFGGDGFVRPFLVITVVFAVALGFRQSAWESANGTYLFLLHLPRSREAVFLTKLATGLVVLVGCATLPVVGYATWASLPGRHPGPFAWSMTAVAWQLILAVPLMYVGAFLSGLRPGWWFGSRLLPLVTALVCLVLVAEVPWQWPVRGVAVLAAYAALVTNVCFVARTRDYA